MKCPQIVALILLATSLTTTALAMPTPIRITEENKKRITKVLVTKEGVSKSFWCLSGPGGRQVSGVLNRKTKTWFSIPYLLNRAKRDHGVRSSQYRSLLGWKVLAQTSCRAKETPSQTPHQTGTPQPTGAATASPTQTPGTTVIPSPTSSQTPVSTQSPTPTVSQTPIQTVTPKQTATPSSSPTRTPTATATASPTVSPTASATPTATPSPTLSPTPTASPTQSPFPTATGWTQFAPQPGALTVYVSTSGNDASPGTISQPKRTIAGGYALLRSGQPDWLLLRRGDVFAIPGTLMWQKSGPAPGTAGWMRMGAYGDESAPRPVIDTGSEGGMIVSPGYQASQRLAKLSFTDINFRASTRLANPAAATSAPTGIQMVAAAWEGVVQPFNTLLFENLRIQGYAMGIVGAHDIENLVIRRNIIDHIFNQQSPHSTGILAAPFGGLMEENVLYSIQSPNIPGLGSLAYAMFAHAMYLGAEGTNIITRRNIMINTPDGIMQRAGGLYYRNVSAHCNVSGLLGQAWGVTPTPGGINAQFEQSLILNPISEPFYIGNTALGTVRDNTIIRDLSGGIQARIALIPINGGNIGVHNTDFINNYLSAGIDWDAANTASFSSLTFQGNQINMGVVNTSIAPYLSAVGISGTTINDLATVLLTRDRANFGVIPNADSMINFYRVATGRPLLN